MLIASQPRPHFSHNEMFKKFIEQFLFNHKTDAFTITKEI